jgi:hypothetical protein
MRRPPKVPSRRATIHHEILSQRGILERVVTSRNNRDEDDMPFLFWMPMIVMCGLWRAAEEDARTLFPPQD